MTIYEEMIAQFLETVACQLEEEAVAQPENREGYAQALQEVAATVRTLATVSSLERLAEYYADQCGLLRGLAWARAQYLVRLQAGR